MESKIIHKVYDFFDQLFHFHEHQNIELNSRICPITGLDISMQPKNSKFLSVSGVKWYHNNDRETYTKKLQPLLTSRCLKKEHEYQFRSIAHKVRNADSNPRNNARRAINKLLEDDNCLFDNLSLIDNSKLKEAQILMKGSQKLE